ncbi:RluA family pseudouridine synthase [Lentilactobacillus sp. G22-6]|uniref:RluA family pseudouridine synthase n=1 Tax=Lentilactobacillus dabitei TaxID=2831523 RepID=UPI001C2708D5|nr:RluA family pseudouridine synthase [Lentilactobacillus dabitei]MBU9789711.1 RluA family pseudouridine synthase [Lentilactobacillus dabitei]
MTEFTWQYQGDSPIKVRTFIMGYGITRTLLKKIKYHGGQTLVNGQASLVNRMLAKNDVVTVILPPEPENDHVNTSQVPIRIVHEDPNFLVVDKPAGVASVPSHGYVQDTLVNRVKGYYQRKGYANQKIHIVTRLDKDTSGLVVFAKHHFAHSVLDKQLKDRTIQKAYLAIAAGKISPNHFEIYLPIGRDEASFVKRQVVDSGKMSITEGWVVDRMPKQTLVRLQLHTGRTHQIRVHLGALGHPLIGDWLYNPDDHSMARQALHCYHLEFYDPFNDRQISCTSSLPGDMKSFITLNRF